jgi:hypothetical protein
MQRDPNVSLYDILHAADYIVSRTKDIDLEQYLSNRTCASRSNVTSSRLERPWQAFAAVTLQYLPGLSKRVRSLAFATLSCISTGQSTMVRFGRLFVPICYHCAMLSQSCLKNFPEPLNLLCLHPSGQFFRSMLNTSRVVQ